jgi:hypothetical protein
VVGNRLGIVPNENATGDTTRGQISLKNKIDWNSISDFSPGF